MGGLMSRIALLRNYRDPRPAESQSVFKDQLTNLRGILCSSLACSFDTEYFTFELIIELGIGGFEPASVGSQRLVCNILCVLMEPS